MIYTNPNMHTQYKKDGKNDFVCTNTVSYYIKNEYLYCVVQMRSNDAIFGYINDLAWQKFVLQHLCDELNLLPGTIFWQAQSLHIYPRHFDLIEEWDWDNNKETKVMRSG